MEDKSAFFDTLNKYSSDSFCNTDDEPSPEDLRLAELFSANRRTRDQPQPHSNHPQRNININTVNPNITTSNVGTKNTKNTNQPSSLTSYTGSKASSLNISKMPPKRKQDPPVSNPSTSRKRSKTKPLQPPHLQIFNPLTFFFMKPCLKRAERKMRIEKAQEYGATVVFTFSNTVTHIIADKDIKYNEILEFLQLTEIPEGIAVTNPRWPGDCIRYGKLVDPKDFWYQVHGCPTESQQQNPLQDAPISEPNGGQSSLPSSPPSSLQVQPRPPPKQQPETPTNSQKDALDEAIEECLTTTPINIEDFLGSSSSSDTESSPESSPKRRKKASSSSNSARDWQSHFQCMHKHTGALNPENPNSRTIQILEEMMQIYDSLKDQWRTRSYRIAISTLKSSNTTYISTYEQAISLPGVGDRLAKKIVEIVSTDRLQRLEYAKLDPKDQILKLFHGIYGVGLVQARKFVAAGYTTLEDVKKNATLTEPQRIGIERYSDFKQRIPREEVKRHGEIVSTALKTIDEKVQSHVMGSYRRGAKDCGDIDIILTKEEAGVEELHKVLEKLVEKLFDQKFLMCGLAIARHDDGTKWHGASRLEGEDKPWRRIDFLVVPGEEIGAAFLYFTGNDVFNRSMRLLASKKGMRLNQKGLYKDVVRGKNREKLNEGTLLESKDEKKIFEILGVPYRPPEHRIC
ncbi:hypothetical protein EYR41_003882 [Orbilia oligospora]|uniref:DNA polymerase n=1 Tax=Orbilia oligospora TaxID=2813651 RepID=A0A7C8KV58_ORBOL|nr:hypothetical protein TWF751_003697 [Orbilia oligospora]TGJ71961.1 hypothetical protein EYR41_003882 [Orbilia oligospora]